MQAISTINPAESDACYLALKAHDARFDGRFFTGVTSTGIYCRPVCKVRTPRRENCQFFVLAAQAELAGFRPCLRCRPELAPGAGAPQMGHTPDTPAAWSMQDASAILAQQAARLLDEPTLWSDGAPSMADVAQRLGVSERHMRRIFETHWGVSPLQYLQTRRLLMAKRLLTDTQLPVAQVAAQSGFSSVRRFNAAFVEHYRLQPRQLRQSSSPMHSQGGDASAIVLKGAYRPPYDVPAMLGFFATRQIAGVESVDIKQRTMARTLSLQVQGQTVQGWVRAQFLPDSCTVQFHISHSLGAALPLVLARLRAMLDLDADPLAINPCMGEDFPGAGGLRVPGCLDGFELAVRAVLGQQITVRAACTMGARLVAQFGSDLSTPMDGLTRLFPTPEALCLASGETLGQIGIVRQRQRAIQALAQAMVNGTLCLQPGCDVPTTITALQALPGIGPWTAQYIAMRALRWPDAFVAGDVALQKALGVQTAANPQQAAEAASQRWKPWRSYAVVRGWASLAGKPSAAAGDTPDKIVSTDAST